MLLLAKMLHQCLEWPSLCQTVWLLTAMSVLWWKRLVYRTLIFQTNNCSVIQAWRTVPAPVFEKDLDFKIKFSCLCLSLFIRNVAVFDLFLYYGDRGFYVAIGAYKGSLIGSFRILSNLSVSPGDCIVIRKQKNWKQQLCASNANCCFIHESSPVGFDCCHLTLIGEITMS